MQDEVKVTQADREAAYGAYFECYDTAPNDLWLQAMLEGRHDEDSLIQVLARHRHQAERETLARMEWRDIESAPKDGRRFLVYGEQKPLRSDRFFLPNQFNAIAHYDSGGQTHKPMLKTDNGMPTHVFTHWMPLPPAPEAGQ